MRPCKNCIHHTACVTANPDMVKKTFECKHFEDKEKIKSALEKQIPKKVTFHKSHYRCPLCNDLVIGGSFCKYCGQALDWGDNK